MMESALISLSHILVARLSLAELQVAAQELGYPDWEERTRSELALELVSYLDRRRQVNALLEWLQSQRPDIDQSALTDPSGPRRAFGPEPTVNPSPPPPLFPLIGRQRESEVAQATLSGDRLLHVAGLPGIGKTVLLQNLLRPDALGRLYPDGIVWVDGAQVVAPDFGVTVARLCGLAPNVQRLDETLRAHLSARCLLVVYDHADDDSQLAEALRFAQTVSPRLVVGSCERRGAPFTLLPLALPSDDEAIAIFRAYASPLFDSASTGDLRSVIEAVGRHPLALRLAATQAVEEQMPLDELILLLKTQALSGLAETDRAFEGAYARLSETERWTLGLASLFAPSGARQEAWLAVSGLDEGTSRAALGALVRRSLLDRQGDRYPVQTLVHQFAGRTLQTWPAAQVAEARARLTEYYLAWARARAAEGVASFALLQAEFAQLERAVQVAQAAGAWETVWGLASALHEVSLRSGLVAANGRLWQAGLQAAQALSDARRVAVALNNLGGAAYSLGDYPAARAYFTQALSQARQTEARASEAALLNNLGDLARLQGDYTAAQDYLSQAVDRARQDGDDVSEGAALNNLGQVARAQGRAEAADYLQQALAVRRRAGDVQGEAVTLNNLGELAYAEDKPDEARGYLEEALQRAGDAGDPAHVAVIRANLGKLAYAAGEYGAARDNYTQALDLARQVGDRRGEGVALNRLGQVAYAQGDYVTARAQLSQGQALFGAIGDRLNLAFALHNLGRLAEAEGGRDEARRLYVQARDLFQALGEADYVQRMAERLAALDG